MESFWENRFKQEKFIWGNKPSFSAEVANKFFMTKQYKSMLIPGSGYGRNADYFADIGYSITGVEISTLAINLANKNKRITYVNSDILNAQFPAEHFDCIYCFNMLHLLQKDDRKKLISQAYDWLKKDGMGFFVVFSELEKAYGKGTMIEENTFETRPGRPSHYFTESDLKEHFSHFAIEKTGIIEEPEEHEPEGKHVHLLRYICVTK
mgnify:CR=1 FL=1